MEQWRNGRRELFEQLTNICNNIEQNLDNELVNGDNTIIRKDELEDLRLKANSFEIDNEKHAAQIRSNENSLHEKGVRIKILEEDVSRLKEELWSNQNAATRADKLEDENRHLREELKKYQNVASRVEDLEEQNKKLSMELGNAAIRARDAELASTDNERSSSFDNGKVPSMGRQSNYRELDNERKRIKEQWLMQKERADKYAEILRDKNAQLRRWEAWNNELHISHTNKVDGTEVQAQRTRKSRSKSQDLEGRKLTTPNNQEHVDVALQPTEVRVTSPTKDLPSNDNNLQSDVDDTGHELDRNEEVVHESPQLPRHVRRSQHVTSVGETQFLPIEPCHSSSTQDPESSPSGSRVIATVGESNIETPKIPSSDDVPEFISARPVRKRKRKGNERESQRTPLPKVKLEELESSSPITARILHASESLDLDDIGDRVVTPRKRRRAFVPYVEDVENRVENAVIDELLLDGNMNEQNQVPTPTTIGQPGRTMITPASKRGKSSVGKPLRPLSTNRILPNTVDPNLPTKRQRNPSASVRGVEEILEDGESTSPAKTPVAAGKGRIHSADLLDNLLSSSPPTKITAYPTPQSVAPEVRSVILPPSKLSTEIMTNRLDKHKTLATTPHLQKHREDLEIQDDTPVPGRKAIISDEGNVLIKRASSRPRSVIKKETPGPERRASVSDEGFEIAKKHTGLPRAGIVREISRPSLRGSRRGSTETPREAIGTHTELTPKVKPGKSKTPTTSKGRSRRGVGRDLDSDDPEREPYRLRPVATLKLDHFKINPNFNQGYDYAYTEVVRGKDRQCLPGCVREECCGKQFGALAQALYPVRENPTTSQKAEEDALLEEYLGDNRHKIWTMGKEERKDSLAQARKWKASNTMGKHKSVVPRRSTPPGFWEADFPTTQEDEAFKKKQKEIEREKVAERYAEAMRPGGAWLFKDE
ncbi:uncharacterized protein EAE98_010509 [Botrytis deweyae]|uniref:DNA endonuclease activator Ctp1 C-terminal domain-containing protein n=1 Tax=Botrytis deweyae TaxID=2478750 RepID=A0ABQ7I8H4_9HELO|nr:uncharacterized protein EAE98_010509 [Botrytis deweyae]KAF7916787.1 hypothetical protein EAE98_010509 [Botrytis deweyae]